MLYSELKNKDVINLRDCRRLGRVCDLEFDPCNGTICKIIVPGDFGIMCLFHPKQEICIPFRDIKQIGPDIILVDVMA